MNTINPRLAAFIIGALAGSWLTHRKRGNTTTMHDDEFDLDNIEEALAHRDRALRDPIIPMTRTPLTREDIQKLNAAVTNPVAIVPDPGRVYLDDHGIPAGVTAPTPINDTTAPPVIRRADLERAGLTEQEVPHVHVID